MVFEELAINFAVSVGSGFVSGIIEKIKGDKTIENHINNAFQKALNRWEVSQELRDLLHSDALNYYTDLKDYLGDNKKARHPKTNELLRFWTQAMMDDDLCMSFIILHRTEISNTKLNDVLETLKTGVTAMLNDIYDNTKRALEKTEHIEIMLSELRSKSTEDIVKSLHSILDGLISSMITELKLDTACKIINEIERLFIQKINQNKPLRAKVLFYKGETLLFSDPKKAIIFLHEAYILQPDVDEYKKWEVKNLIAQKDYIRAQTIAETISEDDKYKALLELIMADDAPTAFQMVNVKNQEDLGFRQIALESLINKGAQNVEFLFNGIDATSLPEVSFSTINKWLFLVTLQRSKIQNYLVLSFESPQVALFKPAFQLTSTFYDLIAKTEISDGFPMVRCLHCYWSYICTRDSSWINEYQKIDRKDFGSQKVIFSLMESSMLVLAQRYEEAFAVIVSTCKVMDESIVHFVIMMSLHSNNTHHLRWALERMKNVNIKINSSIAGLIAMTIDKARAQEIEHLLISMDFEIEGEKELLAQLCNYHAGKVVNVEKFKGLTDFMSDELKACAANLLANAGDTQLAFNLLSPIVEEGKDDIKQAIFLSVLSKMQEKAPMLYRILVKNRKAGNHCNNQLLWKEYQLDCAVADFDNAYEAISELRRNNPENVEVFVNYLGTLGRLYPERLEDYKEIAKSTIYPTPQIAAFAYKTFAENGYLETATDILFNSASITEDYGIRNLYQTESTSGFISSIVHKEYEIADEGKYVLCDYDGKRIFYKVSAYEGNIGKLLFGAHKGDEIDVEISGKQTRLTIIGIHDKYAKLSKEILDEAFYGNNPGLQPFKLDMENPIDSLMEAIRKISKDDLTPGERYRKAVEKYEKGELGLLNLVSEDNVLSGYYNLLFTPFTVHVDPVKMENLEFKEFTDDTSFVLDLPTIITFAEFEAKTGLAIKGPKIITKVLHEYLHEANKLSVRVVNSDFYNSMRSGMIKSYNEYASLDAIGHVENLVNWADKQCKVVIADNALILSGSEEKIRHSNIFFSSLSMLLKEGTYLITDDKKIKDYLPTTNIISTESYVNLFNDEVTIIAYSKFLFECGFRGVDMQPSYIMDEYKKMERHEENKMVAIIQNIQENPFLLAKAITSCILLAQLEFDLNTLKMTFTNMFALALKGFSSELRERVVQNGAAYLSISGAAIQLTRQCLLDAKTIADAGEK